MDGYTILAGALIFFVLFIYLTWLGVSIKVVNQEEQKSNIKINTYATSPLHRKLIDKKNKEVGFLDLGNHILIVGFILLVIFISINVE